MFQTGNISLAPAIDYMASCIPAVASIGKRRCSPLTRAEGKKSDSGKKSEHYPHHGAKSIEANHKQKWQGLWSFHYFSNEFANLDHFASPLFFQVGIFFLQSLSHSVLLRNLSASFPGFSPRFLHGSALPVGSGSTASAGFHPCQALLLLLDA
jgi:hypothetical protein